MRGTGTSPHSVITDHQQHKITTIAPASISLTGFRDHEPALLSLRAPPRHRPRYQQPNRFNLVNDHLVRTYEANHEKAPNAEIIVSGYPLLFPPRHKSACMVGRLLGEEIRAQRR
jgi:hypothetical protein